MEPITQARDAAFAAIEARTVALRMTIPELCHTAGVKRMTYRRARETVSDVLSRKPDMWVKTARRLEAQLEKIEAERQQQ